MKALLKMRILLVVTLICLISCGPSPQPVRNDLPPFLAINPFTLTLTDSDYSLAYALQYVVTEKDLKVVFRGEVEGEKDSILYYTPLPMSESLRALSRVELDSLHYYYRNLCIDDGSQLSITFKKGDKVMQVHLSNYYQQDVGIAIDLINEVTPEQYHIVYQKAKLLKAQLDCEMAINMLGK